MRFLLQTSFLITLGFALPAHADQQSPFKGGMKYTTMGAGGKQETFDAGEQEPEPLHQGPIRHKSLREPEEEKPEAEDPADKVWKKYQALAAGKYEEPEEEKTEDKKKIVKKEDDKSALPPAEANTKEAPAAPSGIAGILQEYNQNKIQRRQMRVISLNPPKKAFAEEEKPGAKEKETEEKPEKETEEADKEE